MAYRDLKISTRVGIVTFIIIGIMVIASISGFNSRERSENNSLLLKTVTLPKVILAGQLLVDAALVQQNLTDIATSQAVGSVTRAEQHSRSFKQGVSKLRAMYITEVDATSLKKLDELEAAFGRLYATGLRLPDAFREAEGESYQKLKAGFDQQAATLSRLLESFHQVQTRVLDDSFQAISTSAEKFKSLHLIGFPLLFLSIILLLFFLSVSITRPIRAVQGLAERLAEGDVDAAKKVDIKAGGEVGDLVRAIVGMADNLREMILKVNTSSDAMADVSDSLSETSRQVDVSARGQVDEVSKTSAAIEKINASVGDVAHSIDEITSTVDVVTTSVLEQVASTEEIAQNVENLSESAENVNVSIIEIASNIKQVSESVTGLKEEADVTASAVAEMETSIRQVEQGANDTAQITSRVRQDAEAGQNAVEAAIAGMLRIKESSSQTSIAIKSFSEKSENIGAILSVIHNLTDETNLLALNAAIIAAQAGEHGRGFVVVADQIKELADQTSVSTKEIVSIIQGVQAESQNAVNAILQAEKSIAEGESLSLQSGEALNKIVTGSQQVADEMGKISSATREQVKGSEMIGIAMDRVSDMVNQIVTAIREQESGSKLIITVSEKMRELTRQINTSTREQSAASRSVATGMEEVNGMIQKVNTACDEQRKESQQIVEAVSGIKQSTQINLESTSVVNKASMSLKHQTGLLLEGIGKFKVNNDRNSSKVVSIQKMTGYQEDDSVLVSGDQCR